MVILQRDRGEPEYSLTHEEFMQYQLSLNKFPLFINGDVFSVLHQLPDNSIDCCMTSPPYWNKREYDVYGFRLESTFQEYVETIAKVCIEIKRILKPTGSFWLNIGDSFYEKNSLGFRGVLL